MILLFFGAALLFGTALERSLVLPMYLPERWAFRLGLGTVFTAWILLLCIWLGGFFEGTVFALTVVSLLSATYILKHKASLVFIKMTGRQRFGWLLSTGFLTFLAGILLYRLYLLPGPGGAYSITGTWGDLPLHLAIMSNVARIQHFTFQFSLMSGIHLAYPFLIDFLSGLFQRAGLSPRAALLIVSLPMCAAVIQLLFFFSVRVTGSFKAAMIALTLFIFSGSSFGFVLAFRELLAHIHHPLQFFRSLPLDYSNTSQYGFGTLLVSILLPQRAFQFGLVMFAVSMILLVSAVQDTGRTSWARLTVLGVCIGCLPFVHTHTFIIVLTTVAGGVLLRRIKRKPTADLLYSLGLGVLLALPQLTYQLLSNYRHGFIRLHVGWMYSGHSASSLLMYVGSNFGLILIFSLLTYFSIKNMLLRSMLVLGAAIFTACMVVIFQPAEYDNIKLLIYAYLFACLGVATWLSRQKRLAIGIIVPLLCVSGVLGVAFALENSALLYPDSAFAEAILLSKALPPDAVVLTSDFHQHPLWGLAGQPTVLGYSYWLWSYGLPVEQRAQDVRDIYAGLPNAKSLIEKYKIQYVLVSGYESALVSINKSFFDKNYSSILPLKDFTLYKMD